MTYAAAISAARGRESGKAPGWHRPSEGEHKSAGTRPSSRAPDRTPRLRAVSREFIELALGRAPMTWPVGQNLTNQHRTRFEYGRRWVELAPRRDVWPARQSRVRPTKQQLPPLSLLSVPSATTSRARPPRIDTGPKWPSIHGDGHVPLGA